MAFEGTYYLGRLIKYGLLDKDRIFEAINNPKTINYRGSSWTIVDVSEHHTKKYIFGVLCKFTPQGEISKIDMNTHSNVKKKEPNLTIANSPFIYIPEFSGIAYLNVYGNIEENIFRKHFRTIINESHDNMFIDCKIEPIADLRTFATKLSNLDLIYKIDAKVSPPNPMFGPLWKPLKEYLEKRNTDKMTIIEDAPKGEGINTNIKRHIKKASEQDESEEYIPDIELEIGDSAIFMAADGYGNGTVTGKQNEKIVRIKTSDSVKSFDYLKTPDIEMLYVKAFFYFKEIEKKRHMKH